MQYTTQSIKSSKTTKVLGLWMWKNTQHENFEVIDPHDLGNGDSAAKFVRSPKLVGSRSWSLFIASSAGHHKHFRESLPMLVTGDASCVLGALGHKLRRNFPGFRCMF